MNETPAGTVILTEELKTSATASLKAKIAAAKAESDRLYAQARKATGPERRRLFRASDDAMAPVRWAQQALNTIEVTRVGGIVRESYVK